MRERTLWVSFLVEHVHFYPSILKLTCSPSNKRTRERLDDRVTWEKTHWVSFLTELYFCPSYQSLTCSLYIHGNRERNMLIGSGEFLSVGSSADVQCLFIGAREIILWDHLDIFLGLIMWVSVHNHMLLFSLYIYWGLREKAADRIMWENQKIFFFIVSDRSESCLWTRVYG